MSVVQKESEVQTDAGSIRDRANQATADKEKTSLVPKKTAKITPMSFKSVIIENIF